MKIKLNDMTDVNCFIRGSEFFDGDVDVKQKHHIVNGKSLISMCSLELSEPINAMIHTEDKGIEEDFYKFIKKWEVED